MSLGSGSNRELIPGFQIAIFGHRTFETRQDALLVITEILLQPVDRKDLVTDEGYCPAGLLKGLFFDFPFAVKGDYGHHIVLFCRSNDKKKVPVIEKSIESGSNGNPSCF